MKHSAYVVVAISLALCGCVDKTSSGAAGVRNIEVKVEGGRIVVPEERVAVKADIGTIMWNLPEKSKYVFPRDGIVIDPGNFSPCAPTKEGKSFTCPKRGHRPGNYKYIVNVNDGTTALKPLPLPPLDPWVINDGPGV
ncbi:MAG: hypothetical protein E6H51_06965 [Betaproteobacteria bacterium]|nr:MAG: hypothetical protein E6H70_08820 [Betaproteobacteria bacterium]TMH76338.1 MAG: hypothetical protein E6H51_06965 [Betaproteobacteria bacterium]